MATVPQTEVGRRWWAMMSDIMAVNDDNSPVEMPLVKMFYLPRLPYPSLL